MANGDVKFVQQQRLPSLIQKARNHPVYGAEFKTMDDWEVYQKIKETFPAYELDEAPEEWRTQHVERILHDMETPADVGSLDNPLKKRDPASKEPLAQANVQDNFIFSLGGLYKLLPEYLEEAYEMGVNESVTGLAAHLLSGEAPFKQDIEEAFGEDGPDVFQNALAFGAGMAWDFWMFINPITAGSRGAIGIASKVAIKNAQKQMAKQEFGSALSSHLLKDGVSEGFEGLTKTGIAKAFQKGETAEGAKQYLLKNTRLKSTPAFERLYEESLEAGADDVARFLGSKEWVSGTNKALLGELLPKPTLQRLVASYGMQSAKALGSYSAVQNFESQMKESLVEQYGEDAPSIVDRWKSDGEWLIKDVDPGELLYSSLHGYIGGFVAGGLSGVRVAGMGGHFKKGKFEKWLKKEHPGVKDKLYNGWKANAGWIAAEGIGFTAAGRVTEIGANIMGMDIPYEPLSKSLLQNIVTIGTMRGLHKGWRKTMDKLKEPTEELGHQLRQSLLKHGDRLDKIASGLEETSQTDTQVKDLIKEKKNTKKKNVDEDNDALSRSLVAIEEGKKKLDGKNINKEDIETVTKALDKIIEIAERTQGNPDVSQTHLDMILKKLNKIKKGYGDLTGKGSRLDAEMTAFRKRRNTVKKAGKEDKAEADEYLGKRNEGAEVITTTPDEGTPLTTAGVKKVVVESMTEVLDARETGKPARERGKPYSEVSKEIAEKRDPKNKDTTPDSRAGVDKLVLSVKKASDKIVESQKLDKDSVEAEKIHQDNLKTAYLIYDKIRTSTDSPSSLHRILNQWVNALAKEGKTLNEGLTNEFLQRYINTANKGGQYSRGAVRPMERVRKYIEELREAGQIDLKGSLNVLKIKKVSEEYQARKSKQQRYVPPAEAAAESINIVQRLIAKGKAFIGTLKTVGKDPSRSKQFKITTDSNVVTVAHFIQWAWGKRAVALATSKKKSDREVWDLKGEQTPLRLLDLEFTTSKGKNKRKKVTIHIVDKGMAVEQNIPEALVQIVAYQGKDKVLGYDVYKALWDLRKSRRKEGAKESDALLTYKGRDGSTKDITSGLLANLNERYYLKQSDTGKETPHQVRTMWLSNIAPKIVSATEGNPRSRSLEGFVDKYMLSHDRKKQLEEVQSENVSITGEKHYTGKQLAARSSYKQKLVLELYKAMQEGKLTSKLFDKIVDRGASDFKKIEGYELFADKTDPFKTQTSSAVIENRSQKSRNQEIGLTEHRVSTDKELKNQFIDALIKNRGLRIEFIKGESYAGEFIDGVIRLVEGKASIDTFFHENVHRLESFVKKSGDKQLIKLWSRGEKEIQQWAIKNDKDGWNRFVEKYGGKFSDGREHTVRGEQRAANEYLTQLSAEWSVKKSQTNTIGGRLSNWFKQLVSRIKSMMGLHNPQDVARIFGDIAEKGFSTVDVQLKGKKYSKITKDDIVDEQQVKDLNKVLKEFGVTSPEMLYKEIAEHLGIDHLSKDLLTQTEYVTLRDYLDTIEVVIKEDGTHRKQRVKSWKKLRSDVAIANLKNGIKKREEVEIKKFIGIKGGTMKNASEKQMMRYLDFVKDLGREPLNFRTVTPDAMINQELANNLRSSDKAWDRISTNPLLMRGLLPVDYVLRKLGANKIADSMLSHYRYESALKGEAAYRINKAMRLMKKEYGEFKYRKVLNKYMGYVLDPANLEGVRLDQVGERFVKRAGLETTSNEYKAVQEIRKLTDYLFNTLIKVGKANIKNPRQLERWLDENNKLFVESYFTRIPTPEAKEFFNKSSNKEYLVVKMFNRLIEDVIKDRDNKIESLEKQYHKKLRSSKEKKAFSKEIKALEAEKSRVIEAASDNTSSEFKKLRNTAVRNVDDLIYLKRNVVFNPYLLKRGPRLDNVMKNEQTGKEFNVYETNFDKVMGRYVSVMTNYLATAKYFPSYTNLRSTYVKANEDMYGEQLRVLGESGMNGAYVELSLRRRLGLAPKERSKEKQEELATMLGRYSAVFGLSSPMSGLKNLVIGTTNTIGLYGFKNYLRSIATMLSHDSIHIKDRMVKSGITEIGTKELELTGFPDFVMRRLSWMKPTEVANRYYSAWAGLLSAEQLVSRLRGESWTLFGKFSGNRARKELKNMWNLSEDDIMALQNYGLRKGDHAIAPSEAKSVNKRVEDIRNKIMHYSHIKSQGATAEPFLPLWTQNRTANALTLFYRMAYASTYNVAKHIAQPALKGNIIPATRYLLAGHVLGGALWQVYESLLGTAPPKANEDDLSVLWMNLSKAETLGLGSAIFSPYDNWLDSDSIMQPAIIRNLGVVKTFAWNVLIGPALGKAGAINFKEVNSLDEIHKALTSTTPLISHTLKVLQKNSNPYKTTINQLRTYKKAFLQDYGLWEKENKSNPFNDKNNTNSAYYNLMREAFLNNDLDSAARYFWATRLYLWDNYREFKGRENYFIPKTRALTDSALEGALKYINPLHFPKSGDLARGQVWRAFDKRKEFLNYLSDDTKAKAISAEKTYWFRYRQLKKEIDKYADHYGGLWNDGKVIDALPIPPRGNFPLTGRWTAGSEASKWFTVKSKTSQIAR